MHQVDIAEAVQALPDLIKEAMNGEEVVITQENQPLVKLSPIEQPKQQRIQAGSTKGMIWMSDDFDVMRILLDTHTFLWFIAGSPKLF